MIRINYRTINGTVLACDTMKCWPLVLAEIARWKEHYDGRVFVARPKHDHNLDVIVTLTLEDRDLITRLEDCYGREAEEDSLSS